MFTASHCLLYYMWRLHVWTMWISHRSSKFTRKHQTIAITQTTTTQKQPYCPKHTSELLDIFCKDCDLIICSTCLSDHEEHTCCELKENINDFRCHLDNVLAQTDQYINVIQKAIKVTLKKGIEVRTDVTKLKQQTSAAYRAILRHVELQEERHLASIDEYYKQAEKVITETLDKQEILQAVAHSIQLYGQHLSKARVSIWLNHKRKVTCKEIRGSVE